MGRGGGGGVRRPVPGASGGGAVAGRARRAERSAGGRPHLGRRLVDGGSGGPGAGLRGARGGRRRPCARSPAGPGVRPDGRGAASARHHHRADRRRGADHGLRAESRPDVHRAGGRGGHGRTHDAPRRGGRSSLPARAARLGGDPVGRLHRRQRRLSDGGGAGHRALRGGLHGGDPGTDHGGGAAPRRRGQPGTGDGSGRPPGRPSRAGPRGRRGHRALGATGGASPRRSGSACPPLCAATSPPRARWPWTASR